MKYHMIAAVSPEDYERLTSGDAMNIGVLHVVVYNNPITEEDKRLLVLELENDKELGVDVPFKLWVPNLRNREIIWKTFSKEIQEQIEVGLKQ